MSAGTPSLLASHSAGPATSPLEPAWPGMNTCASGGRTPDPAPGGTCLGWKGTAVTVPFRLASAVAFWRFRRSRRVAGVEA
eukprot:4878541-Amphidinium_carterae.2